MVLIKFHSFLLGDVEDPDIYVAAPLYDWQQTTKGKWVMENCKDVAYIISPSFESFGYVVNIKGKLDDKLAVEYYLRWS